MSDENQKPKVTFIKVEEDTVEVVEVEKVTKTDAVSCVFLHLVFFFLLARMVVSNSIVRRCERDLCVRRGCILCS